MGLLGEGKESRADDETICNQNQLGISRGRSQLGSENTTRVEKGLSNEDKTDTGGQMANEHEMSGKSQI